MGGGGGGGGGSKPVGTARAAERTRSAHRLITALGRLGCRRAQSRPPLHPRAQFSRINPVMRAGHTALQ